MATIMSELRALADLVAQLRNIAHPNTALANELALVSGRLHTLAQRMERIMRDIDQDPRDTLADPRD